MLPRHGAGGKIGQLAHALGMGRRPRRVNPPLLSLASAAGSGLAVGALSATHVYDDLFSRDDEQDVGHIRLAREADLILVAPATADRMAQMAAGLAGDLAGAVLLRVLVDPWQSRDYGFALSVAATVVSRHDHEEAEDDGPSLRRIVLDAGSKVLGSDRPAWATGYGRLPNHPRARITALSEHHATVVFPTEDALPAMGEQLRRLRALGIPCDVTPGVPSFAAGAAALGAELTLPGVAQSVVLTRTPGRAPPIVRITRAPR